MGNHVKSCCHEKEETKKDESTGTGYQEYENGDSYRGRLVQGLRSGYGIYFYKNGNKYEGEFLNGTLHGDGVFYYKNGEMYKGHW